MEYFNKFKNWSSFDFFYMRQGEGEFGYIFRLRIIELLRQIYQISLTRFLLGVTSSNKSLVETRNTHITNVMSHMVISGLTA